MRISEREQILRWFYRKTFPSGILEFDDFLNQAVRSALGKSQFDTDAYVVSNRERHWNALRKRLDDDIRLGRSPLFRIIDIQSIRLSWIPENISTLESKKEKKVAMRLYSMPYILKMIDYLSERQYEALGCVISELAGATDVKLTPRGNDAGIDFFALIKMPAKCHIFRGNCNPLRIVGQSKKHEEKVSIGHVREFITTIQEIKNQNYDIKKLVPVWFWDVRGPIAGWMISHNGMQSGAHTKARSNGIIVSESIDLAEIAALSRQIDNKTLPNERVERIRSRISSYLERSIH